MGVAGKSCTLSACVCVINYIITILYIIKEGINYLRIMLDATTKASSTIAYISSNSLG